MQMQGVLNQASGSNWTMYHGDSCQVLKGLPNNSIELSVSSPPFSNLYIYSSSEADLGNSASNEEFMEHYSHIIRELFRTIVPGRVCCVHCKDLPKYANRDGTSGLIDFPGMIIREFESFGFSFHSRITIWKCPVVERERTNNNGLLHKTVVRDRSQVRQGMADYLLVFRKPPEGTLLSDKPIAGTDGGGFSKFIGQEEFDPRQVTPHPSPYARTSLAKGGNATVANSINLWRRLAEPVWWDVAKVTPIQEQAIGVLKEYGMSDREIVAALGFDETDAVWFDIDQMDVIQNYKRARSEDDVRHICPLQIGLIRRAIQIWSKPGDVVLSPFAGIGSEGVGALMEERKFIGCELKPEYFGEACRNLKIVEEKASAALLFDLSKEDGCEEGCEVASATSDGEEGDEG